MCSNNAAARLSQPALLPLHGVQDKKPRSLDREANVVGRARGCDVALDAADVSHVHCIIFRAAEGLRIRDCGTRSGTKINGSPIKTIALVDGDVLQVGPFSFTVQIPESLQLPGPVLSRRDVDHLTQSRRRLAELGLRLRKKLAKLSEKGQAVMPGDSSRKASGLKAKIKTFDQRLNELEQAERELVEDREALNRERESHRAHVQQVEQSMSRRLEEVDEQVRQRWQDFQQRCRLEESRLADFTRQIKEQQDQANKLEARSSVEELRALKQHLEDQARQLGEERVRLSQEQKQFASDLEAMHLQKEEIRTMLEQLNGLRHTGYTDPGTEDQEVLERVEVGLQRQRQDLARMMGDLEKMQAALHVRQDADLQALLQDNDQLRRRVVELEELLTGPATLDTAVPDGKLRELQNENDFLRQLLEVQKDTPPAAALDADKAREIVELTELLKDKEQEVVALKKQATAAATASRPLRENDLETYEAELNQFRQHLEKDRGKLNAEIDQLRFRNAELDEAVREMEMEMSRERAELARERTRLDRLREDTRLEMERTQREGSMRESLVNVNKLREEMGKNKQAPAGVPLADRLKNFRNKLTD